MKKTILVLSLVGTPFMGAFYSVHADVLDHWTTNQITTNSFALSHVVYGNGVYVATAEFGDGGAIYSSVDGFNWTQRFSDNNSWGLTLNYSAGHFAGVGGFGIADVSADGTNWTSTFLPSGLFDPYTAINAITYAYGLYVTVGDTNGVGNILTSPDGVTWTSRSIINGPGGRISSVAASIVKFVAIGNNDGFVYTSPSLGSSAGVNWTKSSILGGSKISYARNLFIVPLNVKTNLISVDGLNWSSQSTGLTNMLGAVTYGNGLFMAQCGISNTGSYLATSTDGTNWVQYPQRLPNLLELYDLADPDVSLATDGTRLVTIGETNNSISIEYNSFVYTSDVLSSVRMTRNLPAQVALSGLVGRTYQIQSADSLTAGANNWQTEVTLQLPSTPYVWTDPTATNSARFYRGVLMP